MDESPCISQSAAETLLNVTVSNITPNIILCVLLGEIDLLTEPLVREKLAEAVDGVSRHLVLDLSNIQFLGSTGLQILVDLRAAQQVARRRLALVVGSNRMVTRPLQVTELDRNFDLHAELATAVEACRTAEGVPDPGIPGSVE